MSKHTPGPWAVNPLGIDSEDNLIFARTLASGTRRLVASATTGADAPANRRLIAAAPDLLEALEAVISHGSMTGAEWVEEKVLAAIAKARGEA